MPWAAVIDLSPPADRSVPLYRTSPSGPHMGHRLRHAILTRVGGAHVVPPALWGAIAAEDEQLYHLRRLERWPRTAVAHTPHS